MDLPAFRGRPQRRGNGCQVQSHLAARRRKNRQRRRARLARPIVTVVPIGPGYWPYNSKRKRGKSRSNPKRKRGNGRPKLWRAICWISSHPVRWSSDFLGRRPPIATRRVKKLSRTITASCGGPARFSSSSGWFCVHLIPPNRVIKTRWTSTVRNNRS